MTKGVMLITGGTGSIGRVIAELALSEGWSLVVQGRSRDSVTACINTLRARHPNAALHGVDADIKTDHGVRELVDAAAAPFGRLDAVVDCLVTGPDSGGVTGEFSSADPDALLPFCEYSIVYLQQLVHHSLPWLRRSKGSITTFVSDAALFAAPWQSIIGAARAAAIGFVRNLAVELASEGVRVNCISPAFVKDTASFAKLGEVSSKRAAAANRRAGLGLPTPNDIAPLALFLSGAGAQKITGQVISVNGGLNA